MEKPLKMAKHYLFLINIRACSVSLEYNNIKMT